MHDLYKRSEKKIYSSYTAHWTAMPLYRPQNRIIYCKNKNAICSVISANLGRFCIPILELYSPMNLLVRNRTVTAAKRKSNHISNTMWGFLFFWLCAPSLFLKIIYSWFDIKRRFQKINNKTAVKGTFNLRLINYAGLSWTKRANDRCAWI